MQFFKGFFVLVVVFTVETAPALWSLCLRHTAGWVLSRVPALASFAAPPVLLGRAQPDVHAVLAGCS